jgi:precorrin-2 dehydrogenase / sirohydrochlorin ferrochelatase
MYYPLFLNLRDQRAVVIGAGPVAARKVRTLLAAGARVAVISPAAAPSLARLAQAGRVTWQRRAYRAGDLRGATLAIAATSDQAVNVRVCTEAMRRRLLVNCVAPPAAGNFLVPALVRRGRLALAISTGGASPALAKQIRRELEQYLRAGYRGFLKQMQARRRAVAARRRPRLP